MYVPFQVEYIEAGTPITNTYYLAAMKGEMYGLDHNKERFSADMWTKMRPETAVPNLYLTGRWRCVKAYTLFSTKLAGNYEAQR